MTIWKSLTSLVIAAALSGCALVPSDGPLLTEIASAEERTDEFVYGLIDLDAELVASLTKHTHFPLNTTFGLGNARSAGTIGTSDVLEVTIFEAGPDGIFSTTDSKSVTLRLTVQDDGRISVPFAGTVLARGRTIEHVRRTIISALQGRAVEPDVIVNIATNNSEAVVVNGAVNGAQVVPLMSGRERLLDVIGAAGGPSEPPYDTFVTVSRSGVSRTVSLLTMVEEPKENIYVRPDDAIFLTYDPRVFMAFGAVDEKGRHPFETRELSLIEAASIAGGLDSRRANPEAYFVFRYEYGHVIEHMLHSRKIESETLYTMMQNPYVRDEQGRLPIIYRIDMSDADNYFTAKRFPMRADDVIYVARKSTVDFERVLGIFTSAAASARTLSFN